jgi:hypothetical protein
MNNQTYDFYNIFLAKMPYLMAGDNHFDVLLLALQENLQNHKPISIDNHVHKLEMGDQITYWRGLNDGTDVQIIVDTFTRGNFQQVMYTAKDPNLPPGTPPYTSDLYMGIKGDIGKHHLTFTSGSEISPEAARLWHNIVKYNGEVSVYDTQSNQYELTNIKNPGTINDYIGGPEKQRYIFVLSENKEYSDGLSHYVNLMELKRRSLIPLFEHFKKGCQ